MIEVKETTRPSEREFRVLLPTPWSVSARGTSGVTAAHTMTESELRELVEKGARALGLQEWTRTHVCTPVSRVIDQNGIVYPIERIYPVSLGGLHVRIRTNR